MHKLVKILLAIIFIALITIFVVILVLEIYNPFTFFLLVLITMAVVFAFYFFAFSDRGIDEAAIRSIRIRAIAKRSLLKETLITRESFSNQSIDTIICYNCGDIFIEKENVCDKCGAPRPKCVVCGLDLSPETDPSDEVIITPCCSVYVHTEHILEWLEIKEICPNCKQKITKENLILSHKF